MARRTVVLSALGHLHRHPEHHLVVGHLLDADQLRGLQAAGRQVRIGHRTVGDVERWWRTLRRRRCHGQAPHPPLPAPSPASGCRPGRSARWAPTRPCPHHRAAGSPEGSPARRVPLARPRSTSSPTAYWSSSRMKNPDEHVADEALRAEGQRAAQERDGQHERAERVVDDLEDGQDGDDPDHADDGALGDGRQGLDPAPPRGPGRWRPCRSGPACAVARRVSRRRATIVSTTAVTRMTTTLMAGAQSWTASEHVAHASHRTLGGPARR